jgi:hypothetical protein
MLPILRAGDKRFPLRSPVVASFGAGPPASELSAYSFQRFQLFTFGKSIRTEALPLIMRDL